MQEPKFLPLKKKVCYFEFWQEPELEFEPERYFSLAVQEIVGIRFEPEPEFERELE